MFISIWPGPGCKRTQSNSCWKVGMSMSPACRLTTWYSASVTPSQEQSMKRPMSCKVDTVNHQTWQEVIPLFHHTFATQLAYLCHEEPRPVHQRSRDWGRSVLSWHGSWFWRVMVSQVDTRWPWLRIITYLLTDDLGPFFVSCSE